MSQAREEGSPFPNTSWSMVAQAGHVRSSVRRRTIEALVKQYQPALRSYLMARRRIGRHEADDLLQGFLADKVLDKQILTRADRSRGKFRTFLMTALERFAISQHRMQSASRRSPGTREVSSLDEREDIKDPVAPEAAELFDPALADAHPVPYEQLVPHLNLRSPEQAANLLATAKRMFSRNLREVTAEYADDEGDAEEEVRRLKRILSQPRAG